MSVSIYVQMFIAGTIGIVWYTLEKMSGLQKKYPDATPNFIWHEFLKAEWLNLIWSYVVLLGIMYISSEFLPLKQLEEGTPVDGVTKSWGFRIALFIKTVFVGIGYMGVRVVYKFLGRAERRISKKLDSDD